MIPAHFSYARKSIEPKYSFNQPGELEVNRLIRGQAYWKQTTLSVIQENKTLILADWTASTWPKTKLELVTKKLIELLNNGFTIYVWQSGQIEELSKDNLVEFLHEPQMLERMTKPAVIREIESIAINELPNIAKDQLLILDDYQINGLIQPEVFTQPRILDTAAILASKLTLDQLIPTLENAYPPITSFTDSILSEESYSLLEELQKRLPNLPIKPQFITAHITDKQVEELIKSQKTILAKRTIHLDDLQSLEEVTLDDLSSENILKILPYLPNIKKLNLFNIEQPLNFNFPENFQLPLLEKIKLFHSKISTKELYELFKIAPQIKTFCIYNSNVMDNYSLSPLKLNYLKTIKLRKSSFSKKNYQELLIQNTLTKMHFADAIIISDTLTEIKDHDLSSIKILEIKNATCDANYLYEMFKLLPQLEHVVITGGKIERFTGHFTLKSLKSLHIDLARFNDIAHAFDNVGIEKLILIDEQSTLKPNLDKIDFSQLKHLAIINNKINPDFLNDVIKKASRLNHLDLQHCSNLNQINHQIHLGKIDTLNLSHTDINDSSLISILSRAPNLKRLDLTGCNKLVLTPEVEALLKGKQVYYPDAIKNKRIKPAHYLYKKPQILTTTNSQYLLNNALMNAGLSIKDASSSEEQLSSDKILVSGANELRNKKNEDSIGLTEKAGEANTKNAHETLSALAPNTEKTCDADTKNSHETLNAKEVFFPLTPNVETPTVSQYRKKIYHALQIEQNSCDLKKPFLIKQIGDLDLTPCDAILYPENVYELGKKIPQSPDHNYFYGKESLTLSSEWQSLNSLSAQEKITHYHIDPHVTDIEIKYSKRDNQYYIRKTDSDAKTVSIDFILEVPKNKVLVPASIQELIDNYIGTDEKPGFSDGALVLEQEHPTGLDYLEALLTQKKGACRHRTIAFKHQMEQLFPETPVRIISNDVHMQPEIQVDKEWIACNLGGYPADVKLDTSNQPKDKPSTVNDISSQPEKPKESEEPIDYDNENNIVQFLQTWKKTKQPQMLINSYCEKIIEPRHEKKYLIETTNKTSHQALILALKDYCKKNNKPFYYIDKPDDLTCSSTFITNVDNKGIINDGPGGRLHEFLTANHDEKNPPILLINYDPFDADDIVHHNSLYEDNPKADGTPLPAGTIIIGIMNLAKPNLYQGEDIMSRMDKIEGCPLSDKLLAAAYPELSLQPTANATKPAKSINLFQANNWKDILLGQWILDENNLYFQEGELQKALKTHHTLHIQNGLWEDSAFNLFWKEALKNRCIDIGGHEIQLPEQFEIFIEEGYDWNVLKNNISIQPNIDLTGDVLNPSRFNLYFSQYELVKDTQGLKKKSGIIEQHAGKTLSINLSRELNEHQWAMLLTECRKHHVTLECHCFPDITLPEKLQPINFSAPKINTSIWDKSISSLLMINSTDISATTHQLTNTLQNYVFIEVSELEIADILEKLQGKLDKESKQFVFDMKYLALNQALSENKNIVLAGTFSNSLLDNLLPILFQHTQNPHAKGTISLIFDQNTQYALPNIANHQVSNNEKLDILLKKYSKKEIQILTKKQIQTEAMSQLEARIIYHKNHPEDADTSKAWAGLYELKTQTRLSEPDLKQSKEITRAIIDTRIQDILTQFTQSPMMYLSGLTGVGKTTFVEKYLGNLPNVTLYMGEKNLHAWAEDKSDKLKIIFIDEANIGKREWSEFEGLFLNQPSIFINGQCYKLSNDRSHVALFAGNPLNYGSERQLAPLFKRHGNAYVFEPMSCEFIYEEILKPLFEHTRLKTHAQEVSKLVLSVYSYLVKLSDKEVLITPRELQLIVMLTIAYHHKHPTEDFHRIVQHYAYQIGKTMVPYANTANFEEQFKPANPLYKMVASPFKLEKSSFLITPSRQELYYLIRDLLNLRHFRQNNNLNTLQKFAGIGGVILEGEPGIGKSELVSAILASENFSEAFLNQTPENEDNFYRIPISMPNDDKKALSLKALENADLVIVDEINSAPFLERWYNDIFMSTNPVTKKHPEKSGSLLIATQNPPTMSGRKRPSNALSRRIIKYVLPPYPAEEMISILVHEGLELSLAEKMVYIYTNMVNYAHKNYLSPAPTFRNLLRLAKTARNTKQMDALQNFFDKIKTASLRESLLQTESSFKTVTVNALTQYMNADMEKLFEHNINLFQSLIKKSIPEHQVAFLLDFLKIIKPTGEKLNDQEIGYIHILLGSDVTSFTAYNQLNEFFAKNQAVIPVFFSRAKRNDINTLIKLVVPFIDYQPLVCQLLSLEKYSNELLSHYSIKASFYEQLIETYTIKHQDTEDSYLLNMLQIAAFLDENTAHEVKNWQKILIDMEPKKINLIYKWLEHYKTNNKKMFLNLFYSNAVNFALKNNTENDVIQFTDLLLNNAGLSLFDMSKNYQLNPQRNQLFHMLLKGIFISRSSQMSDLWTSSKNQLLLENIFKIYETLFHSSLQEHKPHVLLSIAKELREVNQLTNPTISPHLSQDMQKVLTNYLGSFWIRNQRKQSARALSSFILPSNRSYPEILREISKARKNVFTNDTEKERGMHRFGQSRYYETLNTLETMLINNWCNDPKNIASFKAYLPEFETNLEHSRQCLQKAIDYENNRYKRNYTITTPLKAYPGYIQALKKEVLWREEIYNQYKALPANDPVPQLANI